MKLSLTKKSSLLIIIAAFAVYTFSWVFVYLAGLNKTLIPSEDTLPAVYLPLSLIRDGDFYLDEFMGYLGRKYPNPDDRQATPFYVRLINGHYVSGFPVIAPVMAVPVYLIPALLLRLPPESLLIPVLGKLAAALIAAGSVGWLYLALRRLVPDRTAKGLAFIYAFATSTFALSSQGLWQHGPSQFLLTAALYLLLVSEEEPSRVRYVGGLLSFATLARPTSFLPAAVLSLYALYKYPRYLYQYIFWSLLPLLPWMLYNQLYFGSPLQNAYTTGVGVEGNWTGGFPEGFLGIWLSPSKGLLVYSPIFLFSLMGMVRVFRRREVMGAYNLLFRLLALVIILFTLMMGKWYHWYGGWSYSYRMAVDVSPFLVFLLVPVVRGGLVGAKRLFFLAAVFLSALLQLVGIVFYDGEWHARYDQGPVDTRWLWSVRESELVYYARKVYCRLREETPKEYLRCQGLGPVKEVENVE